MTLNAYTSIIPLNETYYIIYNALTDRFIICNKLSFSIDIIGEIHSITDRLKEQLIEIGAISQEGVDEAKEIERIIDKVDNDNQAFHLHVNPTLNCNFRCWYCYEEHQVQSKMQPETIENILALVRNIASSNKELKKFHLSFFGGEPIMYYNHIAGPLIEEISKICEAGNIPISVHFTTNGYLLTPKIIESLKNINVSFQITLDGGRDFHNKVRFARNGDGSYDTIFHNIVALASDTHNIVFRINYTCENIDSISDIIEDLKQVDSKAKPYIQVDFQRVWQESPTVTEAEIISKIGEYVKALNDNGYYCAYSSNIGPHHVRNSCYGDKKNHLLVNYDGNIFLCTARDFKPQNSVGKLKEGGVIEWDKEKYNKYRTCKFSREICKRCRIAPLCGGGCRQRAYESSHIEGCLYGYTQEDIDKIILNKFQMRYLK